MVQIDDTIVSLDLIEQFFCCDLAQCKGACCIEGESGAPLEKDEINKLQNVLPAIWDDLSAEAQAIINRQSASYIDSDSDVVTSIVNGKDCVFTCYDAGGCCRCAIEKAYNEGHIEFFKPISCRLYPVRVKRYKDYYAVNYNRWDVCRAAEKEGEKKHIRLYQFLREPLIHRFGNEWYQALDTCAKAYLKD